MEARSLLTFHQFVPRRTRWTILVVLVVLVVYNVFGHVMAPSRISPELQQTMEADPDGFVDIELHLRDQPVPFHITRYREFGSVGGIVDNAIIIRRVEPESVEIIARDYWVQWVDLIG